MKKETITEVVKIGMNAAEKVAKVVNRETIGNTVEATSKGADLIAKGASFLSRNLKSISQKIKR